MKRKYIQLPPLPMDLPMEQIEIIWLYAKMPEEKRRMLLEFMKENVEGSSEELTKTEFAKILNDAEVRMDSDLAEYVDYTKRFLGILFSQACDTAGFVYQRYCIEGKGVEEISRESGINEEFLRLITQYYNLTEKNLKPMMEKCKK